MTRTLIILCLFTGIFLSCSGQKKIFRVEDDEMILLLTRDMGTAEIDSILSLYDMKKLSVDSAWRFGNAGALSREGWSVRKKGKASIEIYKTLSHTSSDVFRHVAIHGHQGDADPAAMNGFRDDLFGFNSFKNITVVQMPDSVVGFTLHGFNSAKDVYLSGSFNNWSTSGIAMTRAGDKWTSNVRLAPGRYEYKFIVDGRWMRDPQNQLKSPDNAGDHNSVFYVTNHTFRLEGYSRAEKVFVSGNFNEWKPGDLQMEKVGDIWLKDVFLPAGTYTYKFVVDGSWITDPSNKEVLPDGTGNVNSVLTKGIPTEIILPGHLDANQVILSGSFNNWATSGMVMSKTATGWKFPVVLRTGIYEYRFIRDGQWITDESTWVVPNESGELNNFIVVNPNHEFSYVGDSAKTVTVTGSFIGWREPGFPMRYTNGKWTLPFYLPYGKNTYKLIVDGQWLLDPANKLWEENEFGTGNSVIWIK